MKFRLDERVYLESHKKSDPLYVRAIKINVNCTQSSDYRIYDLYQLRPDGPGIITHVDVPESRLCKHDSEYKWCTSRLVSYGDDTCFVEDEDMSFRVSTELMRFYDLRLFDTVDYRTSDGVVVALVKHCKGL